jgi:hypothetical protein
MYSMVASCFVGVCVVAAAAGDCVDAASVLLLLLLLLLFRSVRMLSSRST